MRSLSHSGADYETTGLLDDNHGMQPASGRPPRGRMDNRKIQLRGSGEPAQEDPCTQLLDQLRRSLKGAGDER